MRGKMQGVNNTTNVHLCVCVFSLCASVAVAHLSTKTECEEDRKIRQRMRERVPVLLH